jgi:hypothetical protein
LGARLVEGFVKRHQPMAGLAGRGNCTGSSGASIV